MIKATMPEMATFEEYTEEIKSIWEDGAMTNNGPKVKKLAESLSEYMECKNIDLFVNGHSAMLVALLSLDLPKGGEVLTSPFTFASTTNAIEQMGLKPVFCDIDDTYNISIDSILRNITSSTCAIITPHIFGIPCHVDEIERVAREYGLKVVFDGAQSFGTKVKGKNIGNFGDITMFSLHAIKLFNSIEGGILSYKEDRMKEKFQLYRNFGISYGKTNDVICSGINAKMNEFSAAMGLVNLPYVDTNIIERKKLANYYVEKLSEIPGISTFNYLKEIEYNYAYFPIIVDVKQFGMTRDELWSRLNDCGVQTRKLYDTLTCEFSYYKDKGYRQDVKFAKEITSMCLDLPIYTKLSFEDIDFITNTIRDLKYDA